MEIKNENAQKFIKYQIINNYLPQSSKINLIKYPSIFPI